MQTGTFTLKQIKAATDNFAYDNKIGEGGFGPVYKVIFCETFVFLYFPHSFRISNSDHGLECRVNYLMGRLLQLSSSHLNQGRETVNS